MGVCLARYFMHIYVIVLDIGSSECDSEDKATEVLHSLGILIRAGRLVLKLRQHNFC